VPLVPSELQPDDVERLGRDGWFMRPQWLAAPAFARASGAARGLEGFAVTGVGRGAAQHVHPAVRGDERVWLDDQTAPTGLLPVLLALDGLRLQLNREAFLGLHRTELQLSRFPKGGAHYQRHRDSFQGRRGRRITAIYYLNEGWLPAQGGCLRLHLDAGLVDVSPVLNCLVVFQSEQVEHEVLCSRAARYALTAWWSGSAVA